MNNSFIRISTITFILLFLFGWKASHVFAEINYEGQQIEAEAEVFLNIDAVIGKNNIFAANMSEKKVDPKSKELKEDASSGPIVIEGSDITKNIVLQNTTEKTINFTLTEYIDGEKVNVIKSDIITRNIIIQNTTDKTISFKDLPELKDIHQFEFNPSLWDEHKRVDLLKERSIPRTDRSGNHEYMVVVKDNNSGFTVSKKIDFNIDEKTLNVARVRQEGKMWCWAASLQAILNYMGDTDIRACELVNRARERKWYMIEKFGIGLDALEGVVRGQVNCCEKGSAGQGCDFGIGTGKSIFEFLPGTPTMPKMLELKGYSMKLHVGRMSENEIKAQIDSGKPLIIMISPHIIVARGYRILNNDPNASNGTLYLHIMDPLVYPHYMLVSYDDLLNGKYQNLQWHGFLYDIQFSSTMTDEERIQKVIVDVPDNANAGIPFEARLTGMPDRKYFIEWSSTSPDNVSSFKPTEGGIASEWTINKPGKYMIIAKVFSDEGKKSPIAKLASNYVKVNELAPRLKCRERSERLDVQSILDIPIYSKAFGIPIKCYLTVDIHGFDVTKMTIEPSWQYRDQEGVYDTGAAGDTNIFGRLDYNDLKPTEVEIYKGIFNVEFRPDNLKQGYHGSYEIQVIIKSAEGTPIGKSNIVKINYGFPLKLEKTHAAVGEILDAYITTPEESAYNVDYKNFQNSYTLKWSASDGAEISQGGAFNRRTLKALRSGRHSVKLELHRTMDNFTTEYIAEWEATGSFSIRVTGPEKGKVGKEIKLEAIFKDKNQKTLGMPENTKIEWMLDGNAIYTGHTYSFMPDKADVMELTVAIVREEDGKKEIIATTEKPHRLIITEDKKDDAVEKQKEQERIEEERRRQVERERLEAERLEQKRAREQAEKDRIEAEQTAAREQKIREEQKRKVPPTCTYQYSEWGECSRATKKHMRSVIGVKPEGCVEKGNPELEQGCTPPPTAKELKEQLMDCLCRASGATRYTPDGCATCCSGNGVCSWSGSLGGFWCRHMRPDPPEKAADCYEIVYGKKANSAELSQLEKDIRDADKKNRKPLKVTLAPDAKTIKAQYGTTVSLTAKAEGGMPGYTYSWSGNGEGKDNTFTFINTRKPGTYAVSVTVNDSDGGSATAATSIAVEAITVTIEKTSPAGNTVPVGGQASFKATVTGATDLNYLWQPHPEVEFNPFEKSATSTATFRNPGSVGVWVDVLIKDGAVMRSVGQSNVITMQVVNPQWALEFSPANPRVGQSIKAKISPTGPVAAAINTAEMNFRWQLPANANQTGTSQDGREITFVLKDTKPANISCTAATKRKNENLGGAGKTITAQGFEVKVSGPRGRQDFQIWKCETQLGGAQACGMKKVENQFAAGNEIIFGATVEPTPEKPISYNWTVSPSGCSIASPFSRDIGMTCSSTGSFTVKVSAKSDGMEIGSASASVSVTISQNDISRSNKSKEAYEKLKKAKELVSQGKLDEGIGLIDEVVKLDPKHAEAAALGPKWRSEKQTVMKHIENIKKHLLAENIVQAEKDLAAAQQLHPKYAPVVEVEINLNEAKKKIAEKKINEEEAKKKEQEQKDKQAQKLADEGYSLEQKGDLAGAIKKYQELVKLVPDKKTSEHIAELQTKIKKEEAKKKEQEQKDKQAQKLADEGYNLEKKGDLGGAIKKYQELVKLVPDKKTSEHIAELQTKIKEDEAKKKEQAQKDKEEQKDKQAQKLADEGYNLEKTGDLGGAIKKYQEAVKIVSDKGISEHIAELQTKIKEDEAKKKEQAQKDKQEQKDKQAQKLADEGYNLEKKGDLAGAIKKYQAAVKIVPDRGTSEHIAELQTKIKEEEAKKKEQAQKDKQEQKDKQAQKLADEGYGLEKKGDLAGAIKKYQEAVKIVPDRSTSEHIAELQNNLKKQKEEDRNESALKTKQSSKDKQAQKLADEGYGLEKKGDLAGAIKKYKEAVKLVPDKSTSEHIADLQKKIKEDETGKKEQKASPDGVTTSADSGQWRRVETTPGIYSLTLSGNTMVVTKQGNNPGGLQHAGMSMDLSGEPVTGDFEVQVGFRNARIGGGLNQVELHAGFADGIFFVVRDREGNGSHVWAPGLRGNTTCSNSGTLRIERRGDKVTGYCDDRAIWSDTRKSPLQSLSFILQNNGTNDPISVIFHDWRFRGGETAIEPKNIGMRVGPMEMNTDRMGADIRSLDLSKADPALCQAECVRTQGCTAWTYVKPNTKQGPRPRCWLKHSSPGKNPDASCISGIIERDPPRQR